MSSLKKYLSFQHICTILTFQSVAKAAFSCLQSIKVTFLILHHFPVLLLPLCLPVVLSREPARPRSAEDPLCTPLCNSPGPGRPVLPLCLPVVDSIQWTLAPENLGLSPLSPPPGSRARALSTTKGDHNGGDTKGKQIRNYRTLTDIYSDTQRVLTDIYCDI